MKYIPRRIHAFLDIVLIIAQLGYPWIFFDNPKSMETIVLMLSGMTMLCYSLLTKYEIGLFRFINMKNHLSIEFITGLFLAVSPWFFEFGSVALFPHLVIGSILMLLAVFSDNTSMTVSQQEETFTF